MDTHFSKVIATESKPKNKYEQSLPPRRGQIKGRIFKGLALTIGSLVCSGCGGGKHAETGGLLSSNTTTPATTPTEDSPDARLATPF
ncbi:hypothetical protein FH972_011394 [Carpinus fangiana]|uniref:Uncharacterized protein n=1 Tax=Carpinus fangiana TaxID=176857 RepID=A0A660KR97_9ROSI|nr:hypothetical protein FH972_011394 [Carpinus fangiana]